MDASYPGLMGTGLKEYSFEGDNLRFLRAQPSPSDIPIFTVAREPTAFMRAAVNRAHRSEGVACHEAVLRDQENQE